MMIDTLNPQKRVVRIARAACQQVAYATIMGMDNQ